MINSLKKVQSLIPVKLAAICGILSPAIVFITFVISIYLHPWFVWEEHALSNLGALGAEKSYAFNLGLIFLGITFFLFTMRADLLVNSKVGLAGARLLPFLAIGPALVALFPMGTDPHVLMCVIPYSLVSIIMILVGIDYFKSSDHIRGIITFLLLFVCIVVALLPLLYNIGYFQKLAIIKFPSQSIPELISAIVLSLWMMMFVSKMFTI